MEKFKFRVYIPYVMILEILFIIAIIVAILIFVRLSRIKFMGKSIVSLKYRITISLIFPVAVFLVGVFLFIGLLIFFALLIVGVLFFMFSRIRKV